MPQGQPVAVPADGLTRLFLSDADAPARRMELFFTRTSTDPAISLADLPLADEFALVVTRRCADGSHEPVAVVDDESLIERAIRKAA